MKFVDFVSRDAIRTNVEADAKEEVIRAMAASLLEAGKIKQDQFESIVEAILKREELGSTGIGRGVAVPHTKHASVSELVGAVAVSSEGVDFENISRQLRDDTFCRFLKQSKSPADVWQLLEEADNNQFGG